MEAAGCARNHLVRRHASLAVGLAASHLLVLTVLALGSAGAFPSPPPPLLSQLAAC